MPDLSAPAPLSDAGARVRLLDQRWFMSIERADTTTLEDLLDLEYVLVTPTGEVRYRAEILSAPRPPHLLQPLDPSVSAASVVYASRTRCMALTNREVVTIRRVGTFKSGSAAAQWLEPLSEYDYVNLYRLDPARGDYVLVLSRVNRLR